MKKIFLGLLTLILFTGCGSNMGNTPTKQVEDFLGKYQTSDSDVMSDLEDTISSLVTLNDDEQKEYRDFMKEHYEDMQYTIKDEKIDGDKATVETEISVRNYADAYNESEEYYLKNKDKFKEESYPKYRLEKLKEVSKTETYTINFHLTKVAGMWKMDNLSEDDEAKLNGFYGAKDFSGTEVSQDTITNDKMD